MIGWLCTWFKAFFGQRWVRFGIVGLISTGTYAALGLGFSWAGCPVLVGNTLAYCLSFACSYLGQKSWTFASNLPHKKLLPKFALLQGAGLALNTAIIAVLMYKNVPYVIAMPIAIVLVPVFVYVVSKVWVFRAAPAKDVAPKVERVAAESGVTSMNAEKGTAADCATLVSDQKPRVSVIMNCFNSSKDLAEAMDSVVAQSFTDWEIIFWDNGSTDASPHIARSYGPKVRYFRAETTVPLGAARNLAIEQARGECIAFLDCDDLWLPQKLERQMEIFDAHPRVGLVCTDTEVFQGSRVQSRLFAKGLPPRGMVFQQLMEQQWISMSSAVIRRSALDSLDQWFDESLNMCEEADLFYRIAHDWELDYVNAPLTRWRVHANNTTFRKFGKFAAETLLILEKHRSLYPNYDTQYGSLVALLSRRAAFQRGVSLWREGHNAAARDSVRPYAGDSLKFRLFMLASWLPGSCFDALARLYFSLPTFLRR